MNVLIVLDRSGVAVNLQAQVLFGASCGRNAVVNHGDLEAGHQEAGLTHPVNQLGVAEPGRGVEDFWVSPVTHPGAGTGLGHAAHYLQGRRPVLPGAFKGRVRRWMLRIWVLVGARMTLVEPHPMGLAIPVHLHVQSGAQGVDHRRAHSVQAAHSRV